TLFVALKRIRLPDLRESLMSRRKLIELFEKFMVAVDVLATSPAPIQKRLEEAYKSFVDVESKDFDDTQMQATFEQIRSRLKRGQHGQTDSIAASCSQMSDQKASEVADFIFSLFLRIAEKYHSSSGPESRGKGSAIQPSSGATRLGARKPSMPFCQTMRRGDHHLDLRKVRAEP